MRREALGDALAQAPQRGGLRLAAADHAVLDPALARAVLEQRERGIALQFVGGVELGQHVVRGTAFERPLRAMAQHVFERAVGEELERGQAQPRAAGLEHLHQRVHVRQREQHHVARRRRVGEAHGHFDHDAERAFRSDREVAQVVAARILDQAAIEIEQVAVAVHELEPADPLARVAVADHADAARVGRDVAADRARAARSEVHRVGEAALGRRVLQALQREARLHRQRAVDRIEVEHAVHAFEADHELAARGDRAARQAGAPARRHQADPVRARPVHDRLHLFVAVGQRDRERRGRPAPRPVAPVVLEVGRVGLQHQCGKAASEVGEGSGHRRRIRHGSAACQPRASRSTAAAPHTARVLA